MFLKFLLILSIGLFGTCRCIPIANEHTEKETGKPFRHNENEQRQLETVVTSLLGSLLPQLQTTLASAIQGAASNLLDNFSIWDIIRSNGQIPSEYLEDSPAFDSYVVNLPNVGSFVMLAANKPGEYDNQKKPTILNKPIVLEQHPNSEYVNPSLSLPHKPIIDSEDIEFDKPEYVLDYKPVKKPYHDHIGSTDTLDPHDDKLDSHKNTFHFDKKKASFSEHLSALQHKFHEQKEKIIAESINHINKLQSQLIGQIDDYHTKPPYYTEYETPHIIKKPIKKPASHYVGYKATNVHRDSDFE